IKTNLEACFPHDRVRVVGAPCTDLRRGHPLNIGLDVACAYRERYGFACILDDDDILYPNFTSRLVRALETSGADIVYGSSLRRDQNGRVTLGYDVLPFTSLLAANFITTNSYVVRTDFLSEHQIRTASDMHYLEDYSLLLRMLESGVIAHCIAEPISEFTTGSDGNTTEREHPEEFSRCQDIISLLQSRVAACTRLADFRAELLAFPFNCRSPLTQSEYEILTRTENALAYGNANA
ncbi:MAG: hypothetical protein JSS00_08005, partial [Proteobacteria bacterium]|nr:hypothetical protein [Pseudomonadota bacterium]